MKKILTMAVLLLAAMTMNAVPAKRGQWKIVTLSDGSQVRVELRGDEFLHFWQAADGTRYTSQNGSWQVLDTQSKPARQAQRRRVVALRHQAQRRRAANNAFTGTKKGLIILVDFSDKQFQTGHNQALYNRIANEKGYAENGFRGSVSDYFADQSHGLFNLTFDVVGPVRASRRSTYYGGSSNDGSDEPVDELVKEACRSVNSQVNFADYDWDGDGEVDQVFVLYAGQGQADGGGNNTIWPHEFQLTGYDGGTALTFDGVKIDTYACSCELNGSNSLDGIGTICHEFSHCMGLPDLYDTNYADHFGMGDFDLMSGGSYLGEGKTPPCYTAWERWTCGWTTPQTLADKDMDVSNVKPLSENGNTYVIYNAGNDNEYYLLENRQQTGWDINLPSHGLMVTHVDYDKNLFDNNVVNTIVTQGDGYYEMGLRNDHQRLTILHADNDDASSYYDYNGNLVTTAETHDLYPYNGLDSVTNLSTPAATVYNANSDGSLFLNHGIYNIAENADGTVSFGYRAVVPAGGSGDNPSTDEWLLHETFDQCDGTGGNDGSFSGNIASGDLVADLAGWSYIAGYGADRCARFGKSKGTGTGMVSSPTFTAVADTMTLSFRAAGWNAQADGTNLLVELSGDGRFVESGNSSVSLTMAKGAWTTYNLRFTASGTVYITFTPSRRFFLDDVNVPRPTTTGISSVKTEQRKTSRGIYNLSGQYLGNDLQQLPHGIYIVNGKKLIK